MAEINKLTAVDSVAASDQVPIYSASNGDARKVSMTNLRTFMTNGIASDTHSATNKITPVDADEFPIADSAASFALKKVNFGNLTTWIKAIFSPAGGAALIGNTPAGNIAATTVQTALNELDTEKALLAGSATQVFSAATATAGTMAPQANQLNGKNVVINSGCEISQVNSTTLITPLTATWPIDNIYFQSTQASKLQSQQVTNQLNALGATHAAAWSVLAQYTPVATDAISDSRPIEGLNFARFFYGTANAKVASLQFKVNIPAGTYSGAIQNYAKTRSYPFSFTVSAADVTAGGKLVKIENIPGDTAGTWIGATKAGAAYITFDLGSGANFKGTADAWATADYRGVTGASNLVSQVNGTVMAITDVQFEQSPFCTQFERKLGDQVLIECQRYLPCFNSTQVSSPLPAIGEVLLSTTASRFTLNFPVPTRAQITGLIHSTTPFGIQVTGANLTGVTTMAITSFLSDKCAYVDVTHAASTATRVAQLNFASASGQLYFTGAQI